MHKIPVVKKEIIQSKTVRYLTVIAACVMISLAIVIIITQGRSTPFTQIIMMAGIAIYLFCSFLNYRKRTINDTLTVDIQSMRMENSKWTFPLDSIDRIYINQSLIIKFKKRGLKYESIIPLDPSFNKKLRNQLLEILKTNRIEIDESLEFT